MCNSKITNIRKPTANPNANMISLYYSSQVIIVGINEQFPVQAVVRQCSHALFTSYLPVNSIAFSRSSEIGISFNGVEVVFILANNQEDMPQPAEFAVV